MAQYGTFVIEEPYRKVRSVTLDAAISPACDAIWTNAGGDVSITTPDGVTSVFTLAASSGLNIAATAITTSGTTISASALRLLNR